MAQVAKCLSRKHRALSSNSSTVKTYARDLNGHYSKKDMQIANKHEITLCSKNH
jgi:hypothetical protein